MPSVELEWYRCRKKLSSNRFFVMIDDVWSNRFLKYLTVVNFLDGRLRLRQETVVNYGHDFFLRSMVLNLLTVSITSSHSSLRPFVIFGFFLMFLVLIGTCLNRTSVWDLWQFSSRWGNAAEVYVWTKIKFHFPKCYILSALLLSVDGSWQNIIKEWWQVDFFSVLK